MSRDISLGNLGTGRDISLSSGTPPTGFLYVFTGSGWVLKVKQTKTLSGFVTPPRFVKTLSGWKQIQ